MAMPQCCYLAKGAKRPSHTTNTIKFDRIPFDPSNSIKWFDLCPFDQKNSTHLQPPVSAKIWWRTFRQIYIYIYFLISQFAGGCSSYINSTKKYAETSQAKIICRNVSYEMWGISGVCTLSLTVAKTTPTTIASRSPFPLGLCSCSTSLSNMGL